MVKNKIFIAKKNDSEMLYFDKNAKKTVVKKNKPLNKNWYFVGLFLAPSIKIFQVKFNGSWKINLYFSIVAGTIIWLLFYLLNKKLRHKWIMEPIEISKEELRMYVERGRKNLNLVTKILMGLVLFMLLAVYNLYMDNTLFDSITIIFCVSSILLIIPKIDYFKRKKLYEELSVGI